MELTFFGTRGSLPAPGPDTNRFGGNTSCVRVRSADGHMLVLDAGSGIRLVGESVGPDVKRIDLLLTHLHMDHIQGLGFFAPLYRPGVEVHIWGPPSTTRRLRRRLSRYMSPPLFPVRIRDVPAAVHCHDVTGSEWEIGPFRVEGQLVCHPDPTLGFRISADGRSMAYLPDHEPQLGQRSGLPPSEWLSGFSLAEGSDLLVHDAQYTNDEYRNRVGWGHCTAELAVRFAEQVEARRLLLFHHDPWHSDADVERIAAQAAATHTGGITIGAAAELQSIQV